MTPNLPEERSGLPVTGKETVSQASGRMGMNLAGVEMATSHARPSKACTIEGWRKWGPPEW